MKISQKQISLFTEEQLTSLLADSPANPTVLQGTGAARKMNAICGRKCLEQLERLNHVGSWAKTLTALLIGMRGWYSNRCRLIWKMRGTKYSRIYFRLQVSELRTEDTGFGLLLTPATVMTVEHPDDMRARAERNGYRNGTNFGSLASQVIYGGGMLPTPSAAEGQKGGHHTYDPNHQSSRNLSTLANVGMLPTPRSPTNNGIGYAHQKHKGRLEDVIAHAMLPTPTVNDSKNATLPDSQIDRNDSLAKRCLEAGLKIGQTSQLNPRFVAEMMGFPPNYLDNAFERIAWELYQKKKSTKSFQKRLRNGETNQ